MSTATMPRQRVRLLTAEDVQTEIDRISELADKVGLALDEADEKATTARLDYDHAFSRAFVKAEGSVDMRKHMALISTYELQKIAEARDLTVRQLRRHLERIVRVNFEGVRTAAASHRAETASFGPGSHR